MKRQHQPLLRARARRDQQRKLPHSLPDHLPDPVRHSIKIAYFNINAGQTANIYSVVTSSLSAIDEANGQRLHYQGVRYAGPEGHPNRVSDHHPRPHHRASPPRRSSPTGTEDWFDSGWYFNGRRDYNTSLHSYVGTNQPAGNVNTAGMTTNLWSKWGGVPFTAVIQSLPEAGCTTGDTLCWCILYYQ